MKLPLSITSKDNQHVKFAKRVRDGKEPDHIFIEGARLCEEAVRSGLDIDQVFINESFSNEQLLKSLSFRKETSLYLLPESIFDSIADTKNSQGIILIGRRPANPTLQEVFGHCLQKGGIPIWIFLYGANNPANLGAVIRTAEAAGAQGVVISGRSADPFSPKGLRGSMGSAFRLPVVTNVEVAECLEISKRENIACVAIDGKGKQNYVDQNFVKPTILFFGSEASGIPDQEIDQIGESIRIEMNSTVESLNLAVACGVVLFEARRQFDLTRV